MTSGAWSFDDRALQTLWFPLARIAGSVALLVVALLNHAFVLRRVSPQGFAALAAGLLGYSLLSLVFARRWYGARGRFDVGTVFALADIAAWTATIYVTGLDRTLLVLLLILRAADVQTGSFRKLLLYAHASVIGYGALLVAAALSHAELDWWSEGAKLAILYAANVYLALTARGAEALQADRDRAHAAQRAFLANVSHELRTPLTGVIGGARVLQGTELTARQQHHVAMIQSSAEVLLSLIDDVLDFAKIQASKLTLSPVAFWVRAAVAESVRPLTPRADAKNLALEIVIARDVPNRVVGDPVRLRQVLVNLIGNAIKFTDDGEIEIRVVVERRDGDVVTLRVSVRDTGIGVPSERRDAIFEPFTQADGSTTRTHGGSGLGLTIASRLVELMGGRLWLEPAPRRGSIFHFTVPCRLEPAIEDGVPAAPLAHLTALVAEPSAAHRAALVETLQLWGVTVTQADSGAEALTAVERARATGRPFGLVCLAIDTPGLDGLTVAERIRASAAPEPIVMLMRAIARRGDLDRCTELGISAVLSRPSSPSEIWDAITLAVGVPAPAGAAPSARRARQTLSVLIADDSAVNRAVAAELLRRDGHKVTEACDGIEALAAIERQPFDVAIIDLHMPGANGFELTARVRARERETGGRLPIVALTARALDDDRDRCLAAGMDAYLTKPLDANALAGTLDVVTMSIAAAFEAALLEHVGGDGALCTKLARLFLAHEASTRTLLRAACEGRDGPALVEAAHLIKGAAGNFPGGAAAAAARVEALARADDVAGAVAACAELEVELGRLSVALAAFAEGRV